MKEFYTIDEVCSLFGVSKENLKQKCTQYDVQPRRNEIGEAGFVKYGVQEGKDAKNIITELILGNSTMIPINCTAVQNEVADNRFERSELDWMI